MTDDATYRRAVERGDRLERERNAYAKDADRLHALCELLFARRWNGVVGPDCDYQWQLVGEYRHYLINMKGETFRAAIDAMLAARKPKP